MMAFISLIIVAFAPVLAFGISLPVTSLIIPPDGRLPEKNWTIIYYHELTEIDDEITEFRKSLDRIKQLCHSSDSSEMCKSFVDVVRVGVERAESDLAYVKTFDKDAKDAPDVGHRNNYKFSTSDERTYINFEMPTIFQNVSILNEKIDSLSKCHKCRIDISSFGDIVNGISFNLMEKTYKLQNSLFNAQHGIRGGPPITVQQLIDDLNKVGNIIEDQTVFEIDADKMNNKGQSGARMGNLGVLHNRFMMEIFISLKLKVAISDFLQTRI